MGLKFIVSEAQTRSSQASQISEQAQQAVTSLEDSIRLFLSAPLSGKAYESAKNYFSTVYTPICQSIIMTGEALASAHQKFLSEYQATVSGLDTDEDKIIEEIEQYDNLIQEISDLITESKTVRPDLEKRATNAFEAKQKRQEKLDDFREYSNQSASYFSEYSASQQELDTGLAQVKDCKAWNPSTGTFDINRIDMTWATPIRERWKEYEERNMSDSEKLEKNLKEQFGFSKEQAELLMNIYKKLLENFGVEEADKLFWQIMASPAYTSNLKDKAMWFYTAGLSETKFNLMLISLGYTQDEIDSIKKMLLNQYNLCSGEYQTPEEYYKGLNGSGSDWMNLSESERKRYINIFNQFNNTVDFSHTAAIISSYMNNAPMESSLGETLGLYNGVGGLDENSSYIGDVAGVIGGKPSIGNDDYRADLDSMNIYNRILQGKDTMTAINEYYNELGENKTNRADEFVKNVGNGSYKEGIAILQQQYNDFVNSGSFKNMNSTEQKVFAEFFLNILNSNNSMK